MSAAGASSVPSKKGFTLFVGGISWKADEASLRQYFSSFGPVVDCKIIMDRETGKSKGYGFVSFAEESAVEVVKNESELFFLGKAMNVNDAYRKSEAPTRPSQSMNQSMYQNNSYPVPPYVQMPYGFPQQQMYGHPYMTPAVGQGYYPTFYPQPMGFYPGSYEGQGGSMEQQQQQLMYAQQQRMGQYVEGYDQNFTAAEEIAPQPAVQEE